MTNEIDEAICSFGKDISEYSSFEHFLDSLITKQDMDFIEDKQIARQLAELGFMGGNSAGYSKENFHKVKKSLIEDKKHGGRQIKQVISAGMTFENDAMLRALQQREEANRTGKICSIIFIRDYNEFGQEISGYIDYAQRLATEDFHDVFAGKRKLLPNNTDLSCYNWEANRVYTTNSRNYELIALPKCGTSFLNKKDGKTVYVDPGMSPGDNSSRTIVPAENYCSAIIFDHYNRKSS